MANLCTSLRGTLWHICKQILRKLKDISLRFGMGLDDRALSLKQEKEKKEGKRKKKIRKPEENNKSL